MHDQSSPCAYKQSIRVIFGISLAEENDWRFSADGLMQKRPKRLEA
jgi:hypothetical protein